jgi:hypothetical protein
VGLHAIEGLRALIRADRCLAIVDEGGEDDGQGSVDGQDKSWKNGSGSEAKRSFAQGAGGGGAGHAIPSRALLRSDAPASVVVAPDRSQLARKNVALIGIDAADRPGLIHDISRGLERLSLQVFELG